MRQHFPLLLIILLVSCGPGAPAETLERPIPTGKYIDDPMSGRSYNLADFESQSGSAISSFSEAPLLADRVRDGLLPPVSERLPENPLVLVPWEKLGRYGGDLRFTEFTIGYDHYLRHLNEAQLLEQRPEPGVAIYKWMEGSVQPGVLENWSRNADASLFTLRIRSGLKWSNGVPVTTEDVRYRVEDVLFNADVVPILPQWARWGGKPVQLNILDSHTFELKFAKSYGLFLPQMIGWRWHELMLPAHYLKRFHKDHTPIAELQPLMDRYGYTESDWGRFYLTMGGVGQAAGGFVPGKIPDIGSFPTLDPWLHVSQPNPGDYVLERNPYYYKIDPEGQQLPYLDGLRRTFVSDLQVQNLKILSGETDLQFQFVRLSDFPLFKRNEARSNYWVVPLPAWQDYMLIFPLNLRPDDPVLRPIMADVRFRRALSLALNREEIREALFLGFGRPAQLAPLPASPWYEDGFDRANADYDTSLANQLLDEMDLPWDSEHRYRVRPDGKTLTIRIDYYDVTPPAGPGAEMAATFWEDVGIRTQVQQVDGARYWQLRDANQNQVTAWWANGAVPNDFSFAGGFSMTYPWQQWYDTQGANGQTPPEWAQSIYTLRDTLFSAPSKTKRNQAGTEIFRKNAEYLWNIGTVADVPVPFVYSRRLGNIGVAEQRNHYPITVAEAAEQWFFEVDD